MLRKTLIGGAAALVLGLVFLLLAELAHVGAVRFLSAVLLAVGAIGIGVWAGVSPRAEGLRAKANPFTRMTGAVVAVVLALPVVATLIAAVFAAFGASDGGLAAAGILIGGGLAVATIFAVVVTVRALLGKTAGSRIAPEVGK